MTAATALAAPTAAYVLGWPAPLLVAGALAIVAALFLRAGVRFYQEAHPDFPRHELNVKPLWYADIPDARADRETRVLFLPVEFINREPDRRVILRFDVLSQLDDLRVSELSHFSGRSIPRVLTSPVKVEAEDHVEGDVAFDGSFALAFEFGDLMEVSLRDRFSAVVRVTDRVTGATIQLPLPERRA